MLPLHRVGAGPADADLLCGHFRHERASAELLFRSLPDPLHVSLPGDAPHARLQAVVALMREEVETPRPGSLAIVAALSQTLLALALRQLGERRGGEAGMTVFEFMTRVRMAMACELLRDTRRSAGDIGMQVGYRSEAAFGKAFRQSMGVPPGQYRRLRPENTTNQ